MSPRREFPLQPLAGVGAVVLWRDWVLLVERLHPPLAGFWSVPGGLIELGETAAAAARREIREETGLAIAIDSVVTVVDHVDRTPDGRVQYHYVIVDFLAHPLDAGGTLPDGADAPPALHATSDARRARWVALDRMSALPLTPGLEPVVRLACRRRDEAEQGEKNRGA